MAGSSVARFLSALAAVVILLSRIEIAESADCSGDLVALSTQCLRFVQISGPKIPPSDGCCQAVKSADMPCVCQQVTKELEMIISMEKVIYVASYCHRPLVSGTK